MKAIVFDLFHTLVDPEDFRPPEFLRATFAAEAMGVDPDHFTAYWRGRLDDRMRRRLTIRTILDNYIDDGGHQVDSAILDKIDKEMCVFQHQAIMEPREEVIRSLQNLRQSGLRLGLLSNTEEGEMRTWSSSPLADLFDVICMSFEIGYTKPEIEAFAAVTELLGVPISESAFVGNGGHDELVGAKDAGFGLVVFMRGFVANHGTSEEELAVFSAQADATIDSLEELQGLL